MKGVGSRSIHDRGWMGSVGDSSRMSIAPRDKPMHDQRVPLLVWYYLLDWILGIGNGVDVSGNRAYDVPLFWDAGNPPEPACWCFEADGGGGYYERITDGKMTVENDGRGENARIRMREGREMMRVDCQKVREDKGKGK